jgi:hypothetical protein
VQEVVVACKSFSWRKADRMLGRKWVKGSGWCYDLIGLWEKKWI